MATTSTTSGLTDLRMLSSFYLEAGLTFVVCNGSYNAILYDRTTKSFVHFNMEKCEQSKLTIEGSETFPGNWISNFLQTNNNKSSTNNECITFLGAFLVHTKAETGTVANKVCIQHIAADLSKRTVSVISNNEFTVRLNMGAWNYFYQSSDDKVYCIMTDNFNKNTLMIQIIPSDSEIQSFEVLAHPKTVEDGICIFIEDKTACCFNGGLFSSKATQLVKHELNEERSTTIDVSAEDDDFPLLVDLHSFPIYFDGCVFFLGVWNAPTTLWCFDLKKLQFSKRYVFPHHLSHYSPSVYISLEGFAFFSAQCAERSKEIFEENLHIYQCDISIRNFSLTNKELGTGGFGKVVEGTIENGSKQVAIKIIGQFSDISFEKQKKVLLSAVSESKNLKIINHVNIVKGYGFKIESGRFLLFMEKMEQSVRQKILKTNGERLEEKESLRFLQQALEGLVYLHNLKPKPIVHRDIKCANILLDKNDIAKLGDFGFVKTVSLNKMGTTDSAFALNETVGTSFWQAPEVLDVDEDYGRKADVWSIGCSLVEMLTGYPPYYNLDKTRWAIRHSHGKLAYEPLELVSDASRNVQNVLSMCFRRHTKASNISDGSPLVRPHSSVLLSNIREMNDLKSSE